jgi:hypothetical protein
MHLLLICKKNCVFERYRDIFQFTKIEDLDEYEPRFPNIVHPRKYQKGNGN